MESGAVFDATGRYRYTLWRAWSADHARLVFIMLNPSAANEQKNGPTIRRCIALARTWQFGAIEVVNLFAYRAAHWQELLQVDDPVGEENDRFLLQAVQRGSAIVVAWGTKGAFLGRDRRVLDLLAREHCLHCLGVTKDGYPRHPLYVKRDTRLQPFLLGTDQTPAGSSWRASSA